MNMSRLFLPKVIPSEPHAQFVKIGTRFRKVPGNLPFQIHIL